MNEIEIVSAAIQNARKSGNKVLVEAINRDININLLSFDEIIRKYQLK